MSVDAPVCIVGVGAAGLLAAREVKAQLEADASVARRRLHVVGVGGVTDAEDAAADEVTLRLLPRDAADAAAVADVVHARATAPMRVDKRSLVPLPARSSGYALAAQPDDYVAAGGNGTASSEVLAPPADVDVIVVGAGVLGLLAAAKLVTRGYSVAVLDQRNVVGGIWSMYANSASQVNSSEGGYCIKDVIVELASAVGDEETAETTRKAPANRDHSTASEVLRDIRTLAHLLGDRVRCGVSVRKIMPRGGGASDSNGVGKLHTVVSQTVLPDGETSGASHISSCRGVVVAINDRVGVPRAARFPGTDDFDGVVASGTADQLVGTQWRDKRVVIVGMGAFAIENARTALEGGAAHVTIVCRRHGTVCPKIVDYLNFVKARVGGVITIQTSRGFFSQASPPASLSSPFTTKWKLTVDHLPASNHLGPFRFVSWQPYDAEWRHDTLSNVKQMRQWAALYRASGATQPECWPKKHTHEGHTISVSDIWFVAHHLGKLATHVAEIATLEPGGARLTDGAFVPADVVCSCIGFERNTGLCERLTGFNRVKGTNYLAPQVGGGTGHYLLRSVSAREDSV